MKFYGIFYPYVRKSKYERITCLHIGLRSNRKTIFFEKRPYCRSFKTRCRKYIRICHKSQLHKSILMSVTFISSFIFSYVLQHSNPCIVADNFINFLFHLLQIIFIAQHSRRFMSLHPVASNPTGYILHDYILPSSRTIDPKYSSRPPSQITL